LAITLPQRPGPNDNPDWMRWNNIGIAYLDQLQYEDAIHAFQQVIQLRPDYKDGYINLGLDLYRMGEIH
jgi:tetratricopeptide (TPR) repeat protein